MSKKNSNVGSIIIAILSILLVVAVGAFIFKFTNGLNEDLKTFYMEHNGKKIVATDSQMTFDAGSEYRFDCKYFFNPDDNTFNLKVIPNVTEETDFTYTVDGKSHKWSEIKDLTSSFNLDKHANYFIVSFPADFSVQTILDSEYPGSEVVISDMLSPYPYYYTLHVSNYNDKINYYIDFNVIGGSFTIKMNYSDILTDFYIDVRGYSSFSFRCFGDYLDADGIPNIILSKDLQYLSVDAFVCYYYLGDENDWNNLKKSLQFGPMLYYYSYDKPTESGFYWHFVDDIPTIWS